MKFTNYLKSIENVSIYPVITLVLFVAIFAAVCIYVFTADKNKMEEDAKIPLDLD